MHVSQCIYTAVCPVCCGMLVSPHLCVEVIKPKRASMSGPSFSLVKWNPSGRPFLGWQLFVYFLHFPVDLTSSSRQDWREGWAGPSPRLKPSFHFLFASFLAVFLIFAIWPGTVPIQFHWRKPQGSRQMGWGRAQGSGSSQRQAILWVCQKRGTYFSYLLQIGSIMEKPRTSFFWNESIVICFTKGFLTLPLSSSSPNTCWSV